MGEVVSIQDRRKQKRDKDEKVEVDEEIVQTMWEEIMEKNKATKEKIRRERLVHNKKVLRNYKITK